MADEQSLYSLVSTSDLVAVGGRKFAELNNRDNHLVLFDAPSKIYALGKYELRKSHTSLF